MHEAQTVLAAKTRRRKPLDLANLGDPQSLLIRSSVRALPVLLIGALISLGMMPLHTYANKIYPTIKPSFGGGAFGHIRLVSDLTNASTLGALVPMQSQQITQPLLLLGEGNCYAVIVEKSTGNQAVMIDAKIVSGVIIERGAAKGALSNRAAIAKTLAKRTTR